MSAKARWAKLLQVERDNIGVHAWTRQDLERLSVWPSYPDPYRPFDMRCRTMTSAQRTEAFRKNERMPDRLDLVVDHAHRQTVGWIGLVDIDWRTRAIGNMGLRIHPDWCGRGIGTTALALLTEWCFAQDVPSMRLDVSAANPRAVRCYEKCGYKIVDEFWRSDPKLTPEGVERPGLEFLRPHVRFNGPIADVRFYWMEAKRPNSTT